MADILSQKEIDELLDVCENYEEYYYNPNFIKNQKEFNNKIFNEILNNLNNDSYDKVKNLFIDFEELKNKKELNNFLNYIYSNILNISVINMVGIILLSKIDKESFKKHKKLIKKIEEIINYKIRFYNKIPEIELKYIYLYSLINKNINIANFYIKKEFFLIPSKITEEKDIHEIEYLKNKINFKSFPFFKINFNLNNYLYLFNYLDFKIDKKLIKKGNYKNLKNIHFNINELEEIFNCIKLKNIEKLHLLNNIHKESLKNKNNYLTIVEEILNEKEFLKVERYSYLIKNGYKEVLKNLLYEKIKNIREIKKNEKIKIKNFILKNKKVFWEVIENRINSDYLKDLMREIFSFSEMIELFKYKDIYKQINKNIFVEDCLYGIYIYFFFENNKYLEKKEVVEILSNKKLFSLLIENSNIFSKENIAGYLLNNIKEFILYDKLGLLEYINGSNIGENLLLKILNENINLNENNIQEYIGKYKKYYDLYFNSKDKDIEKIKKYIFGKYIIEKKFKYFIFKYFKYLSINNDYQKKKLEKELIDLIDNLNKKNILLFLYSFKFEDKEIKSHNFFIKNILNKELSKNAKKEGVFYIKERIKDKRIK